MINYNISIRNLDVEFSTTLGNLKIIENLNIDFEYGKITGIVGESGSGKSVLGMSILKLLPSNGLVTGSCIYKGNDLYALSRKDIRKFRCKDIGFIAQNPIESLNPVLTIGKQLKEPLIRHLNKSDSDAKKISIEYLKIFGFENSEEIMGKYSFQLSGGMNQRIISIMGLICRPNWIIADEPTKGLDAVLRKNVYNLLFNIKKDYTKSMIIITHDLYFAKKLCDNIVVMHKGEIVETGKTEIIFSNPKHPYTKALIGSTPQNGMVPIIEGINKSEKCSCKFYDRCINFNEECEDKMVKIIKLDDNHFVRCLQYDKD